MLAVSAARSLQLDPVLRNFDAISGDGRAPPLSDRRGPRQVDLSLAVCRPPSDPLGAPGTGAVSPQ